MKFLFEWLGDFIDTGKTPEEAAAALTGLGFETGVEIFSGAPVLDVEITSNRPDCLSVRGVARELSAVWGLRLKNPEFEFAEGPEEAVKLFDVRIISGLCPRYCAKVIRGVKPGPAPEWISRRIQASGIRPVNNIVDATNYSLIATGHPLHAFDMSKLSGNCIIVRQARRDEKLVTLDGVERNLDPSMLVIADSVKPVALAGIMGGAEAEVGDDTEDVLLEGAYFDPAAVRRTAKTLQMDTEASYRFQRGADMGDIIFSLGYASRLIAETAAGVPAGGEIDRGGKTAGPVEIELRLRRAESILGAEVPEDIIREKFGLLGFGVSKNREKVFTVSVPSFRGDVRREIDLVEEAARLYGYGNIPKTMPSGAVPEFEAPPERRLESELRRILVCAGFNEAVNIGLASSSCAGLFGQCMELLNPLSSEQDVLRPSLLPGLLTNVRTNIGYGSRGVRLFESGKIFSRGEEKLSLAGVMAGSPPCHWLEKPGPFGYFHIKGVVEALLEGIGAGAGEFRLCEAGVFDPAESALVSSGHECGALGRILPKICREFAIDVPVFGFELDFCALAKSADFDKKFSPLPKFPPGFRDAAFIVPEEVKSADIEEAVRSSAGELLEGFELFDVYRGEQVPPGKKSMAYSFRYRAADRTLQDAEVASAHEKIIAAVQERLGAALRED